MIKAIFDTLARLNANMVERDALMRLTDHQLADIGLTRDDARDHNLARIWDAPATWKAPDARAVTARLPRTAALY